MHRKGTIKALPNVTTELVFLHCPNTTQQKTIKKWENLIVDDEPNIVMSLEYTKKKYTWSSDGQEVYCDILKFNYLIILDVDDANGWWYVNVWTNKKMTNDYNIKVIFLSPKTKKKKILRKGFN
jgi:hypothetical protein